MDEREKYIRSVCETALFFRDMYEEDNDGDTRAIELLKPRQIQKVKNVTVRKVVLHDFYKNQEIQRKTLTDAAIHFANWISKELPSFKVDDIEEDLKNLCANHEREIQFITDQNEIIHRSFIRAARYLERIHTEGVPENSRVVESFIHDEYVCHGMGKEPNSTYREHVVPCAFLRNECVALFENGAKIDKVVAVLKRCVSIIKITDKQREILDGSKEKGGLELKDKMPGNWDLENGCIFQRLHEAKIAFDSTVSCTCNH